jgi:nucleoside-diphosphate-sugar epimerase
VSGDGKQVRPIVHVKDVSQAILKVLNAPESKVQNEVFNVGSNEQNFEILQLAKIVGDSISKDYGLGWYGGKDMRSYYVNFDKIKKVLGFKAEHTPEEAAGEIYSALKEGRIKESEDNYVIKWYRKLQEKFLI